MRINNFKKLTLLSLLVFGLGACGLRPGSPAVTGDKSATANSKSGDTSTPAQAALLASGDPHAVVTNAIMSLRAQPAYRIRSTTAMAGAGGQGTTSVMELRLIPRMRMLAALSFAES
jgi:hypothetical protein